MPREHARIFTSIWADDQFRALTSSAQRLYQLLITQPDMTYAGVLELRPRRWAACASDTTREDIEKALHELEDTRFLVVDYDTEEVLVRSYLRRDELWKQPKMLTLALRQIDPIQSRRIRYALRVELLRLPKTSPKGEPIPTHEKALTLPDTPGDTPPDTPTRTPVVTPIHTLADTPPEPLPEPIAEPMPEPPRAYAGAPGSQEQVVSSPPNNGARNLLGGELPNARTRPPRTCPKHAGDPDPPNCGKCADARREHDLWQKPTDVPPPFDDVIRSMPGRDPDVAARGSAQARASIAAVRSAS